MFTSSNAESVWQAIKPFNAEFGGLPPEEFSPAWIPLLQGFAGCLTDTYPADQPAGQLCTEMGEAPGSFRNPWLLVSVL